MQIKAYGQIQLKAVDEEQRIIKGIASTVSTDRDGDIVEPAGAVFTLPMPFLWQHKRDEPIGQVIEAEITEKGVEVTVQIAKIDEEGRLKERVDEAWQSIKSGLVKGLSIGFRGTDYEFLQPRGMRFKKWQWHELSAVTIAANPEAGIVSVKQAETPQNTAENTEKPAKSEHIVVKLK